MANVTTPILSTDTDWRTPKPSDKTTSLLAKVPKTGEWFIISKGHGMTVCEQKARILNHGFGDWEYGYRVYAENGHLISDLAVRWVGK